MRILLGLDDQPYSEFAVKQTAKLAINTWADVTLMTAVQETPRATLRLRDLVRLPALSTPTFPVESDLLRRYWKLFLAQQPKDSPYVEETVHYQLVEIGDGVYEEMKVLRSRFKEIRLRLRKGNPADALRDESKEGGYDLVAIGCGKGEGCTWKTPPDLPKRVVNETQCSVLVVKEEKEIERIFCCLDQENVSQDSLEMVSQLATIYGASLTFVGLTREHAIRGAVDQQLWKTKDYYASKGIDTFVQLKDVSQLESFLNEEARPDLLALWMGKKSLLARFFPKEWAGTVIQKSPCSVLVLR